MGQGSSSKGAGTGLAGAGAADGALAINCAIGGPVGGLPDGTAGDGRLQRSGPDVVVVAGNVQLAVCDPADPTTAQLHACLRQRFRYSAHVTVSPTGATSIAVAVIT